MKVYLDCSPLTNAQVSGIGVYNKNLFLELKNELRDDVSPVLKWSRLKNKSIVETHLHHPVTALAPVLLNKKIVYHGTDHKLNTVALGPRVVTIHDMQPFMGQWLDPKFAQGRIEVMTKVLNSDVQRIIAVSHFTKNEIIKYFPHTKDKIDVVYHGHNFKNPMELRAGEPNVIENLTKGRPFLFFVGNIEERKNLINQMKAFEILKETHKDLQFILSGKEGYNFQKIAEYAHQSKYKNDIHITGYLSEGEKNYALKHTRCLMFASFYEGFGIPVIEALSGNSNILLSRSSSLDEVGQGYCYQCDPNDVEEIAATTETIMQKGNLKQVDLESWKRKWSWNKCARETIDVYKKSYM